MKVRNSSLIALILAVASLAGGCRGDNAPSGGRSIVGSDPPSCSPSTGPTHTGAAASTDCSAGTATSYSTSFTTPEKPLSEGGRWTNGGTVGFDWHDVQVDQGEAYAAEFATGYNDNIAVLISSFSPDQYAEGTVARRAGYSPAVSHEIELLLRFQVSAHHARGYEILWGHSGELNIVRWNGPLGDYTPLGDVTGPNIGPAIDGDVLRAEIVGSVIRVYRNGSLVMTGPSNSTWTDGQPGIGFWPRDGASLRSYGWKHFEAGSM